MVFSGFSIWPNIINDAEIHSITWYDDDDFNRDGSTEDDADFLPQGGFTTQPFARNRGQVTGVLVRVLDSGPVAWLRTVTFYDKYGRELQSQDSAC